MKSNQSNLLALVNASYIQPVNLQCAGVTTHPATSPENPPIDYSYVHVYNPPALRPTWNKAYSQVVMTDKNPLFADAKPTDVTLAQTDRNSPNHAGKGNYVLRADGAVTWETTPNVGPMGDNLWTVSQSGQRLLNYVGTEAPTSKADAFVCP